MNDAPMQEGSPGSGLLRFTWWGAGVFGVVAGLAAAVPDVFGIPLLVVSLVLFGIGTGAFLWAYGIAVGRSRTDAIGIGGLYFLAGSAPRSVQRSFLGALGVETVAAVTAASVRPFTTVAFGILAPMHALGCTGLWGARHGRFEPRSAGRRPGLGSSGPEPEE